MNPVSHGNTEGYSKLTIKNQQSEPLPGVEPGTSCTESVIVRCELSLLDFSRQKKNCIMF